MGLDLKKRLEGINYWSLANFILAIALMAFTFEKQLTTYFMNIILYPGIIIYFVFVKIGFQKIHDEIAEEVLPKDELDQDVQLGPYWLLMLELLENGFLQKKESSQARPEQGKDPLPTNKLTSLVIIPSLACNYSCNYCYYRGIPDSEKAQAPLSIDKVKQGIDYFLNNTPLPKKFGRTIRLGGGEPGPSIIKDWACRGGSRESA